MTEEEWQTLIEYLLSQGMTEQQIGGFGGAISQDPDQLKQQGKAQDVYQDWSQIATSYLTGALAGPGAWGPDAFKPKVEREEVRVPGRTTLNKYLENAESTVSHIIARELMSPGGDAYSVRSKMADLLNRVPDTPEAAEFQRRLRDSFPKLMDNGQYVMDPNTGLPVLDFESVFKDAQSLEKQLFNDPVYDLEENGRYYTTTETPTAVSKWFDDNGIPTPDKTYTAPYVMGSEWSEAGPTAPAEQQAMMSDYLDLPGLREAAMGSLRPPPVPRPGGYPDAPPASVPSDPGGPLKQAWNWGPSLQEIPEYIDQNFDPLGWGQDAASWLGEASIPGVDGTLAGALKGIKNKLWDGSGQEQSGAIGLPGASPTGVLPNSQFLQSGASQPQQPQSNPMDRLRIPFSQWGTDAAPQDQRAGDLPPFYIAAPGQPSQPEPRTGIAPPGQFSTRQGRAQFGPHAMGASTDTPEMRAYNDANTTANRARADRFGNDFYRAAGQAKAARESGANPTLDALMKRRMLMMAAGLGG